MRFVSRSLTAGAAILVVTGASGAFADTISVTDTRDTSGNPTDLAAVAAGHGAGTKLVFAVRTHQVLTPARTANLLVAIDIPGGAPRGTRGGPQGDFQILGNKLMSTQTFRAVGVLTRSRVDNKTIVYSFSAAAIRSPAYFDWFVSSGCPERACRSDYAPNFGWRRHRLR